MYLSSVAEQEKLTRELESLRAQVALLSRQHEAAQSKLLVDLAFREGTIRELELQLQAATEDKETLATQLKHAHDAAAHRGGSNVTTTAHTSRSTSAKSSLAPSEAAVVVGKVRNEVRCSHVTPAEAPPCVRCPTLLAAMAQMRSGLARRMMELRRAGKHGKAARAALSRTERDMLKLQEKLNSAVHAAGEVESAVKPRVVLIDSAEPP